MAIGLDGHSKVSGSGAGPLTLNHACGGVQRLLVVVFSGIRTSLTSWSLTVTYDGAAMTQQAAAEQSGNSRNVRTEVWTLVNPPGGSSLAVSVSPSAAVGYSLAAISLTGVDQTTAVGAAGTDTGNKTDFSVGLTTAVADAWLVGGAGIRNGSRTWAPQGSVVEIYEQASGGSSTDDVVGCGDYLVCTGAGSYALAANADSSNHGVMAGVVVRPAAGAPAVWFGAELAGGWGGVWAF